MLKPLARLARLAAKAQVSVFKTTKTSSWLVWDFFSHYPVIYPDSDVCVVFINTFSTRGSRTDYHGSFVNQRLQIYHDLSTQDARIVKQHPQAMYGFPVTIIHAYHHSQILVTALAAS